MGYTDLSSTFVYKGLLTYQQMDALAENDKYFKSGDPTVTGTWTHDQNGDVNAIIIDSEATTANKDGIKINGKYGIQITQDIANGYCLYLNRNLNEAGTYGLLYVSENHAASTQPAAYIYSASTGGFGLQIQSVGYTALNCISDRASNFVAQFQNDGNNANRYGIYIQCGTDDNSGTNIHIIFADGDGGTIGQIDSTGGTVSYRAFTGNHPISTKDNKEYIYGTIMVLDEVTPNPIKKYYRQPIYTAKPSSKSYDKAIFGVYAGRDSDKENNHGMYGLGDGHVLVCKDGGNIETGDYITSSNREGIGMKQDDDLLHNYTVAKSLEDVDWSKEKEDVKLIACTYHAS